MPLSLTVTPGATVSDDTNLDAAKLNQLARPVVQIPDNALTPAVMQISPLLAALLAAGGDSLRGRSFLAKGIFAAEDWDTPEGEEVAAGESAENAAGWTLAPAGGPATAARAQEAPDALSTWCAQLTGGAGVTSLDFYTFVAAGVAGSLRETNLTFSLWVKNLSAAALQLQGFVSPSIALNGTETVLEADTGAVQTFPAGVWTRFVWTFTTVGMEDLANGFRIGIRTPSLNSLLKSMLVAQAQLEASPVAGPFLRPAGSADLALQRVPLLSQEDMATGGHLLVQLATGALRALPNPLSADSFLGYNAQVGAPRWVNANYIVLTYSGTEETVVIPPDVTEIEIHAWGAGAGIMLGYPGGCGGYSWGRMAVTEGQQYTAVVGQAGVYALPGPAFGHGGTAGTNVDGGGGLTGLFTGTSLVTATDTARALVVAGGGGGVSTNPVKPSSEPVNAGGNGNDLGSSGGGTDGMAGIPGQPGVGNLPGYTAGGGGGYVGGGYFGGAARGGTGFTKTGVITAGDVLATPRIAPVTYGMQLTVPGNTSPYYQDGAGKPGAHGLLVIVWNPPAL